MAEPLAVAFEALLVGIAVVLLVSYLSFIRMNPELRRARLFVMAARIHRFLLAFTSGFFAIMVTFLVAFAGVSIPVGVTTIAVFFWLGAVLYGAIEILLIARPDLFKAPHRVRTNHRRGAD